MRASFQVAAVAVCAGFLLPGCKLGRWAQEILARDESPALQIAQNRVSAARGSAQSRTPAEGADEENRALAQRVRPLLRSFASPDSFAERRCPEDLGASSPTAAALVRRVVDARRDGKTLLPLKLRRELESRELFQLEEAVRQGALDVARTAPQRSAASKLLAPLEKLEQRQLLGVYHIVDYREPQLIYNMEKNRRQWTRGVLRAWLSVYPVAAAEPAAAEMASAVCTTLIHVESNAEGLPTSRRRRDETQQTLLAQLAQFTRDASPAALRKISSHLSFSD